MREGFASNAVDPAMKSYLETQQFIQRERVTESYGEPIKERLEYDESPEKMETNRMIEGKTFAQSAPQSIASPIVEAELNKINAEIIGDRVRVSGYLDAKGLGLLKRKIAALEAFLAIDDTDNETEE